MCLSHYSFCQFFSLMRNFSCHLVGMHIYALLTVDACPLPLIAHSLPVFLHMKNCGNNLVFTERKGLVLLRTVTGKIRKKNCAVVCKVFLICTHIFTAIVAKVLPEQERILSLTSAWMSLKGDFSNNSMILPFQDGLFIFSQLITTHLAWLVLLQYTNRINQNYHFVVYI